MACLLYPGSSECATVGISRPARGLEPIDHHLGAKDKARSWNVHAEVSAIMKAKQAGIHKVVAPRPDPSSYWYEDQCLAERILVCSGVEVEFLYMPAIEIPD